MAVIRGFGSYLPERVVTSEEAGGWVGAPADWVVAVSGIEERRFAAESESVADLASRAGLDCLSRTGCDPSSVRMILVASGSGERQFPGPAVLAAHKMGMAGTPAVDLPMASAGSLFGLSLAAELAAVTGPVLVIGAEKMSRLVGYEPREKGVAVLFGDGAGAALVAAEGHGLEIRRCTLGSDGSFTEDLYAEQGAPLRMNGRSVILQASRKIPAAIRSVLEKDGVAPQHVAQFIMHQANQNLLDKVAETLGVAADRFYTNIRRYGNTSSASMLIAAAEWWEKQPPLDSGAPVVLAAFGAGFHWGAILCRRSI